MVESEQITDEEFDTLVEDITREIRDEPGEGVEYIFARWAYWWVMKDA